MNPRSEDAFRLFDVPKAFLVFISCFLLFIFFALGLGMEEGTD